MNVESPQFEAYDARFRTLAEKVELVSVAKPSLNSCQLFLFLYGENGLSEEAEFEALAKLESVNPEDLRRLEVDTDYWQDIVIFWP